MLENTQQSGAPSGGLYRAGEADTALSGLKPKSSRPSSVVVFSKPQERADTHLDGMVRAAGLDLIKVSTPSDLERIGGTHSVLVALVDHDSSREVQAAMKACRSHPALSDAAIALVVGDQPLDGQELQVSQDPVAFRVLRPEVPAFLASLHQAQQVRWVREEANARAIAALNGSQDSIVSFDHRGSVILVNTRFAEVFGVDQEAVLGTSIDQILGAEVSRLLWAKVRPMLQGGGRDSGLIMLKPSPASEMIASAGLSVIGSGDQWLITLTLHDLTEQQQAEYQLRERVKAQEERAALLEQTIRASTATLRAKSFELKRESEERRRAEQELEFRVNYDTLTRLPNRNMLVARMNARIESLKLTPNRLFALLFMDLDGFKLVNDSLGHDVGDELLKLVAERLRMAVGPLDTISRLGGDEFCILLDSVKDSEDALVTSQRVHRELAAPFELHDQRIFLTVSIGVALSDVERSTAAEFLRDADAAMYRAKAKGKARSEVFDLDMHSEAIKRLRLESDLRMAIDRREFVLHYQPIVSITTGALTGFEALSRWNSPTRGFVPPFEFIPALEETGLIVEQGEWAIRQAASQIGEWSRAGLIGPGVAMSVNVARRQLLNANLLPTINKAVSESTINAEMLEVEITESSVMEHQEHALQVLGMLQARGVSLAIDDFGTGYSSLSCLHQFPLDRLKIDRAFIRDIVSDPRDLEVVKAIILMAKTLDLEMVAEGVETAEHLQILRRLGCTHAQGYLFSKPLPAEQATAFLRNFDPKAWLE